MPEKNNSKPIDCSKENLWEAIRTRNEAIIRRCIYHYLKERARPILRQYWQKTRCEYEDIYQDAILKIWIRLLRFPLPEGNFEGYFFKTLVNSAIDCMRRERRNPTTTAADLPTEKQNTAQAGDAFIKMHPDRTEPSWFEILFDRYELIKELFFPKLTDDQQRIIEYRHEKRMSYEEITNSGEFVNEHTGMPLDAASLKVKYKRALDKLLREIILYFLPLAIPEPAAQCPDLLQKRYIEKLATADLEALFGRDAEAKACLCLLHKRYQEGNTVWSLRHQFGGQVESDLARGLKRLKRMVLDNL